MSYRLPKAERLCGKNAITHLFTTGKRFNESPFRVVWQLNPRKSGAPFRFGISVPKKLARLAHNRNRIKRLVREALRQSVGDLRQSLGESNQQLDFFILYSGDIQPVSTEINLKIILILERLKNLNETHPPHDPNRTNPTV